MLARCRQAGASAERERSGRRREPAQDHATGGTAGWLALGAFALGGYAIEYAQGVWPHMLSAALTSLPEAPALRSRPGTFRYALAQNVLEEREGRLARGEHLIGDAPRRAHLAEWKEEKDGKKLPSFNGL